MKISSKEECGIRCMIQLASRGGESEVVTVKEIAEHEGLSPAYVGKLLWALSRSGLPRACAASMAATGWPARQREYLLGRLCAR